MGVETSPQPTGIISGNYERKSKWVFTTRDHLIDKTTSRQSPESFVCAPYRVPFSLSSLFLSIYSLSCSLFPFLYSSSTTFLFIIFICSPPLHYIMWCNSSWSFSLLWRMNTSSVSSYWLLHCWTVWYLNYNLSSFLFVLVYTCDCVCNWEVDFFEHVYFSSVSLVFEHKILSEF